MHRTLTVFVVGAMALTACSGEKAVTTETRGIIASTTTTTTEPIISTTTTGIAAIEVKGAPAPLARLVNEAFDGDFQGPEGLGAAVANLSRPRVLESAVAGWGSVEVAVVAGRQLVLAAVDSGEGWEWVGGKVGDVALYPGFPAVVAVVGSDARPGDDPTTALADSIHLVGLDGAGGAAIVGVPRDSYVPIPGWGRSKINSALANGGPELMMATFAELAGFELDGYVLTGFEGFAAMVGGVLGGFEMNVPETFSDRAAKADFAAGTQMIDGGEALAFSRARKAFIEGDFRRSINGGLVLMAGLGAVKVRGPLAVPELLAGSVSWVSTGYSARRLLLLALVAQDVRLDRIQNRVLDGYATTVGSASVVVLDEAAATEMLADLRDGRLDS